jgi:hypothetical protein
MVSPSEMGTGNRKVGLAVSAAHGEDFSPQDKLDVVESALAATIRTHGLDGGPTAIGRARVAEQLEEMGRHDEGRLLREEVLAARKRDQGGEHLDTLSAELALAVNLKNSGEVEGEALTLCTHVYELRCTLLGPDDEEPIRARRLLASMREICLRSP